MHKRTLLLILGFALISINSIGQDLRVDHPRKNFQELWETARDRYCNFDLLTIDWEKCYDRYSNQITDTTTNAELFQICGNLLKELDDQHVWISRKGDHEPSDIESGKPPKFISEFSTNTTALQFIATNDSILFAHGFGPMKKINPNSVQIGTVEYAFSDSLTYLRINAMERIRNSSIRKAMREIVDSLSHQKGLIVDIRINGGGYDKKGYQFAGYLTSSDRVAIYKHTRKPKTNDFTRLKTHRIRARKLNYSGPVMLLTSDYTLSAADVFALALSDFENITIVGDRTGGFFSDVHTHKLPNGWKFTLSTQKYYSVDMVNYERRGVQPDYHILNTAETCEKGEDPVLSKSLELLESK